MKVFIEGAGEVGSHLAKMLRAESNEVTVIDCNAERLNAIAAEADVETYLGNPSSTSVLREAGVSGADLFISVMPQSSQEINIVSALVAKQLGASKVLARVNDEDFLSPENRMIFKQLGIELMFYPEKIAADEIVVGLTHRSSLDAMDFAEGKLQVELFRIGEESGAIDLKLSELLKLLSFEERSAFRVIAVSRNGNTMLPRMDTKFQYGDLIYTIRRKDGAAVIHKYFGQQDVRVRSAFILGGGAISVMVARSLSRAGVKVKIIEKDREKSVRLSEELPQDVQIVLGDGRNSDVLLDEGIREYDAFLALTGMDENNILSCVVAKKMGVGRCVARVENIEYVRLAEEMGVDSIINKKLITAGSIFKYTLSGKARFVRYMTGTKAEVVEYTAEPDSPVTKGAIKDIDFPRDAIICGVIRRNDAFIAVGDTRVEAYDRVSVFVLPDHISEVDRMFRK